MRTEVKGFSIFKDCLFYKKEGDKKSHWIANALWVQAETKDSQGCGRLLMFINNRKEEVEVWMPFSYLSGNGEKAFTQLMNRGFVYSNTRADRNALLRYIIQSPVSRLIERVSTTGWHKEAYVLPHKTFGKTDGEFCCTVNSLYSTQGSLQKWQDEVARYCVGNSRLILGICAAFASSVLKLFSHENVGFHLGGPSSFGKTTWLKVAGSVFGTPYQSWRTTDNALEGIAKSHNDSLLLLDEMGQVNPRRIGEIAYMLANGSGKGRADQSGITQSISKWRLLFLSNGEVNLENLMKQAHQDTKVGQELRFLNLQMPTGDCGVFENIHNFSSRVELANHLSYSSKCYCGTAIEAFLEKVTQNQDDLKTYCKDLSRFLKLSYPSLSGQNHRILDHFILLAVVGEYARFVTGWPSGEASKGCMACFEDWLKDGQDTQDIKEDKQILKCIQSFFEEHGESRLQDLNSPSKAITNMVGYRDENFYYITPQNFRSILCGNFYYKNVIKTLLKQHILQKNDNNEVCVVKRIGSRTRRVYTLDRNILDQI